jgi:glycogen debranching enzyme
MDAILADGPVTPRFGCTVEINALWYSLLDHCAVLARAAGDERAADRWTERRDRCAETFLDRLWLPEVGYLADRWHAGHAVTEVRPNMVLAAALAASPLDDAMRESVLRRAETDLLTPRGLRTLAPADPAYRSSYRGDPEARDRAYHQGTVWPWLIGSYAEACLRARGRGEIPRLRQLLEGFGPELDRTGLDHVSEVFDGDAPHHPGGTIAQAWNTGELLRAFALLEVPPVRDPTAT